MGTCKTCKHWCAGKTDQYNPFGSGCCEHPKLAPCATDRYPDGATDSECYGGIFTSPDFGCIHHEAKEGQ